MSYSLVIMAAGLGSRYGGIKQMEGVGPGGEILLEYAVYDALKAGFDEIVVILRADIVDAFRERVGEKLEKYCRLRYAIQDPSNLPAFYSFPPARTKPLGTIHAVVSAAAEIDGPFAVLNADDYYGADAFVKMRRALAGLNEARSACMVAYQLKNTVSAHGGVTRGVCAAEGGYLSHIRETHEILLHPDGSIRSPEAEGGVLDGESLVSMNFWGFTREALADMEAYFHAFLRALPPDNLKGECLLPDYVADRIRENAMDVKVLSTDESWFGMTYQADRLATAESLRALHAEGVYPPALF